MNPLRDTPTLTLFDRVESLLDYVRDLRLAGELSVPLNIVASTLAGIDLPAPLNPEQLASRLAQARRGQQANGQALSEARAELELLRPIAAAAREVDGALSERGRLTSADPRAQALHGLLHRSHGDEVA